MKNFVNGFNSYIHNWIDGIEVFAIFTAIWVMMFFGLLSSGITGNDMNLLTSHLFVDFMDDLTNACKGVRQNKLERMINELPEGKIK